MKRIICLLLVLIVLFSLFGCGSDENENGFTVHSIEDFVGKNIAMPTGCTYDVSIEKELGKVNPLFYNDISSQVEALRKGDVQAIVNDSPVAVLLVNENPDLTVYPEIAVKVDYGFAFGKGDERAEEFSRVIREYRANGSMKELEDKWINHYAASETLIDYSQFDLSDKGRGSIRFQFYTDGEPLAFVGEGGKPEGLEIELLCRICKDLGYGLNITPSKVDTMLISVEQGKSDAFGGDIGITPERQEKFSFTDPTYSGGIVFVCLKDSVAGYEGDKKGEMSFWERLAYSFEKTFIRESRWKLILSGLWITLKVFFFAAFFGAFFGIIFFFLTKIKCRILQIFIKVFFDLIYGIPALVVLMVVYFVGFGNVNVSPVFAGIVGFTITTTVAVAEEIKVGEKSVDIGQTEAALSLGASKVRAFFEIVFPQALRVVLPIFKNDAITMLKTTSVLGYIAVSDLTKVGDIIRGRTYEAFFPLITVALIYFAISKLIIEILDHLTNKSDFAQKTVKYPRGVKVDVNLSEQAAPGISEDSGEVIRVEHLKKQYESCTPLKDINLLVNKGDVISIIGPSGTGKSTFLRILNGLEACSAGKIVVLGRDLGDKATDLREIRKKVGMVFQNFNVFNHMSVVENVMYAPQKILKIDKQSAYEAAMRQLRSVGLAEKAFVMPNQLSGGQKQRVAIARALAMNPEIILFDEATSALDPSMVGEVLTVIQGLAKKGMTMLIVTHEMDFAKNVSTRVLYLDQGEVYEEGSPDQIFNHPERNRTRIFTSKVKSLALAIHSEEYDYIAMLEQIKAFCEKNGISDAQKRKLCAAFERACELPGILPKAKEAHKLHVLCEYDGVSSKAYLRFIHEGEEKNCLNSAPDTLREALVLLCADSIFEYKNGKNNLSFEILA